MGRRKDAIQKERNRKTDTAENFGMNTTEPMKQRKKIAPKALQLAAATSRTSEVHVGGWLALCWATNMVFSVLNMAAAFAVSVSDAVIASISAVPSGATFAACSVFFVLAVGVPTGGLVWVAAKERARLIGVRA